MNEPCAGVPAPVKLRVHIDLLNSLCSLETSRWASTAFVRLDCHADSLYLVTAFMFNIAFSSLWEGLKTLNLIMQLSLTINPNHNAKA